jgi:hypothetical protein
MNRIPVSLFHRRCSSARQGNRITPLFVAACSTYRMISCQQSGKQPQTARSERDIVSCQLVGSMTASEVT